MPRLSEKPATSSCDDSAMDHVWAVAEEHLALIDEPHAEPRVRAFAVDVVTAALSHQPPERVLARTFEVLHHLVDRDDALLAEVLVGLPEPATRSMRIALTKLGARAVAKANRATIERTLSSLQGLRVPLLESWMRALMDLTPDEELGHEFGFLFFDWSLSREGECSYRALLSDRPALREVWARICVDFGENGGAAENPASETVRLA